MSETAKPSLPDAVLYPGLATLAIVLWLVILPLRPLFNPDEGRYAEIPREMLQSGDWIVPHLNGLAYVEKPPLQYWATAASLAVFGQNEFGARFYIALCALLTLAIVWWLADTLWDRATAWRAAFTLGGMSLFVVLGQLLTLDMSLTFYLTLALSGFIWAQRPGSSQSGMLLTWIAVALGLMSKGLVAAVIPAAVLVFYSLLSRDFGPWRRLHIGWGLPLFLIITVPWHWIAARRQVDFLEFFFVHEHFSRYLTPSADREEPWWFFGAVLLAGSLPWTTAAIRSLCTGWRRTAPAFDVRRFLWVWVVFIGIFFSLSDSKLVPYLLPVMPALALLIASADGAGRRRDVGVAAVISIVAAVALGATCLAAPRLLASTARNMYFLSLAKPLWQIALVLLAAGLCVLMSRNRDATRACVVIGFGWCVGMLLSMRAAAGVAAIYSGATLLPALAALTPTAPLYSVGTYDQTLPFYLRRRVSLVSYSGELGFGLQHSADIASLSVAEFIERWRIEPQAVAIMEIGMFEQLQRQALPMREIARDIRQVVVARQ